MSRVISRQTSKFYLQWNTRVYDRELQNWQPTAEPYYGDGVTSDHMNALSTLAILLLLFYSILLPFHSILAQPSTNYNVATISAITLVSRKLHKILLC